MNFKFICTTFLVCFLQVAIQASQTDLQLTRHAIANNTMCCSSCSAPVVHLAMLNNAIENKQFDLALDLMPAVPAFALVQTIDNNRISFSVALLQAFAKNRKEKEYSSVNFQKIYNLDLLRAQKVADAPCCMTTMLGCCCYRPNESIALVNAVLKDHDMYSLPTME